MNFHEVADELLNLVKKADELNDNAITAEAPRLVAEARYGMPGGVRRLLDDLRLAIANLPEPHSRGASLLFMIDASTPTTWTSRARSVAQVGVNGSGLSFVGEATVARVSHELCELWRRRDAQAERVFLPFERVSYTLQTVIDPEDPRHYTEYRNVNMVTAAPAQQLLLLHYYYLVPAKPKPLVLTPGFRYETSIAIPESRWRKHILSLPRTYDVGEPVQVEMREEFIDTKRQVLTMNKKHGIHQLVSIASPMMQFVDIAFRLPPRMAAVAQPEAIVMTQEPHDREILKWTPEIDADGWVRAHFDEELHQGYQCLVRFPGLDPYA